jgi:hypothetical protein
MQSGRPALAMVAHNLLRTMPPRLKSATRAVQGESAQPRGFSQHIGQFFGFIR